MLTNIEPSSGRQLRRLFVYGDKNEPVESFPFSNKINQKHFPPRRNFNFIDAPLFEMSKQSDCDSRVCRAFEMSIGKFSEKLDKPLKLP